MGKLNFCRPRTLKLTSYYLRDEIWKNIPESLRDNLNFKDDPDGEFWMNFEDFQKMFLFVVVCNIIPESLSESLEIRKKWKLQTVEGLWVNGVTACGSDPVGNKTI